MTAGARQRARRGHRRDSPPWGQLSRYNTPVRSANLILCPPKQESSINQCNDNNSSNMGAQMSVITARLYHIMKGRGFVWFSGCYLYIPLPQVRSVILLSVPLKRTAVTSDLSTGGLGLQECAGGGDGPLQSEQISTKTLYVQSAEHDRLLAVQLSQCDDARLSCEFLL